MKIFNLSMLTICAMSCGMKLMASQWIVAGVMALCAAYWFVRLAKTQKPKVNISDEAKETLDSLGVKIVVNGKEI